ncbi:heterokaryon incompatibility protein-domain-containing protein [Xylariomycetidae sp. FL2044]|nr:heterokaryon incompatibility protein-domain-containing protein [Xylariomycetidae sp. FL2044]
MLPDNEIRVLRLLPPPNGDTEAPIACDIVTTDVSDPLSYEALSYVWGIDPELASIQVAGQPVSVTRGLHRALQRLRRPGDARNLWIDQLCIDQSNLEEKAQQVRLMRRIYTGCSRCLAWLGEIPDGVALADARVCFSIFEYLAAAASRASDAAANEVPLPAALTEDPGAAGRAMRALEHLLQRRNPWWTRIWTVQEAALPHDLAFLWGPLALPWRVVEQALPQYQHRGWPLPLYYLVAPALEEPLVNFFVTAIWTNVSRRSGDSPLDTICKYRDRRATDPRDKIYGLLGLCDPGALRLTRQCDYGSPVHEVYRCLTLDLIVSERGLKPLIADPRLEEGGGGAKESAAATATAGIPRWAVDILSIPKHHTDYFYHFYGYACYNADAGLAPLDVDDVLGHSAQKNALGLRGVRVGTIVHAREAHRTTKARWWDVPMEPIAQVMRSWLALIEGHRTTTTTTDDDEVLPANGIVPDPYPSGYPRWEAFARLMLGDMIRDGELWPESWAGAADFDKVRRLMMMMDKKNEGDEPLDREFCRTVRGMLDNRTLFVTDKGLMGSGHLDTRAGDQVWIFRGGRVPFVIRPRDHDDDDDDDEDAVDPPGGYEFVGACYVQGVMQGEFFGGGSEGDPSPVDRLIMIS